MRNIILTGRVADDELSDLLSAAEALTFVPLFEGFRLLIVEAFQAKTPRVLLCNGITSKLLMTFHSLIQKEKSIN
jgi:hypothetical protein